MPSSEAFILVGDSMAVVDDDVDHGNAEEEGKGEEEEEEEMVGEEEEAKEVMEVVGLFEGVCLRC